MARDFISIGPAPAEEKCEQVGPNCDYDKMREECRKFIDVIRKKLGPEKGSAKLKVKTFPHESGAYMEVVCYYEDNEGFEYAMLCESESPMTWDDIGEATLDMPISDGDCLKP
jgi:uncharacterized protein YkuJ